MSTATNYTRGASAEDNGLSTAVEQTRELAISQQQAMARYEIEGAIIIAKKYPRNEDAAYAGIIKACQRPTFAGDASYCFPRGAEDIEGPSVYLAREMARLWGNIRYGVDVISDDDDSRTIRAWAWDVQTNARVSSDATFKKLIYRKKGGWQTPDERDLRELTNRHGAFAIRNCLLTLMPTDFIDDALNEAKNTLKNGASANIDDNRKKIALAFASIGVSVEQIELYLGHPIASCSPEQIVKLRQVWKSISDGNSKWADYVTNEPKQPPQTPPATGGASADDLTKPKSASPASKKAKPVEPSSSSQRPAKWQAWDNLFAGCKTEDDARAIRANCVKECDNPDDDFELQKLFDERVSEIGGAK